MFPRRQYTKSVETRGWCLCSDHLDLLSFDREPFDGDDAEDSQTGQSDRHVICLGKSRVVSYEHRMIEIGGNLALQLCGTDGEDDSGVEIWDLLDEVLG